uniref:hypothetical protein n=1 Tax=Mesorhizobium silamurunense TaxID=499528 RepID=UPI001AEDEC2E
IESVLQSCFKPEFFNTIGEKLSFSIRSGGIVTRLRFLSEENEAGRKKKPRLLCTTFIVHRA